MLKGYGIRLSDRRRMSDVIPLKICSEQEQVEEEINGSNQSDNMTHLGEVLVLFCGLPTPTDKSSRTQLIVQCMSGEHIARELTQVH